MSTQKEGFYTKLGVILAVLGLISGYLFWRYPLQSRGSAGSLEGALGPTLTSDGNGTTGERLGSGPGPDPPRPKPPAPPPPTQQATSELPAEFTLSDGEQKVLLSGQVSVGIQFNHIGEEQFLTLRINSSEGSKNQAILGTGGRLRFRNANSEYYVSILRFDNAARTAMLRVDRVAQDG
jgi:hypothetical protein